MIYSIVLQKMWKDPRGINVSLSLNDGDYEFAYSLRFRGSPADIYYNSIIEDHNKEITFILDEKSIKTKKGKRKEALMEYLKLGGDSFFKCFKFLHLLKKNGIIKMEKSKKDIMEDVK